jgi:hypothetical protein
MARRYGEQISDVPTVGFALVLPERIGAQLPTSEFSMAHLAFSCDGPENTPGDEAFGSLFSASGLPASLVIERLPLSRPAAVTFYHYLQPALVLGNGFLPGRYTRNLVELHRNGDNRGFPFGRETHRISPRGCSCVGRLLAARELGAMALPGFTVVPPGEGLRYAGTPMRAHPRAGEVTATASSTARRALFLVDMSVFRRYPPSTRA